MSSTDVAGEIRAIAARQHVAHAEVARRCGRSPMWLARRITPSYGPVPMSVDDLTLIARALSVTPSEILDAAAANGEQR